jgi:hypothetical protein
MSFFLSKMNLAIKTDALCLREGSAGHELIYKHTARPKSCDDTTQPRGVLWFFQD